MCVTPFAVSVRAARIAFGGLDLLPLLVGNHYTVRQEAGLVQHAKVSFTGKVGRRSGQRFNLKSDGAYYRLAKYQ